MNLRFPALPTLVLAAVVWATPPLCGAGPVAYAADESDVAASAPQAGAATCTLTPGPLNTFAFIWTPPEELTSVAWKLPTASCTTCGPSESLDLKTVQFRMRWFRVCTATAEVSIVGATQNDTCLVPDPTQVLCGPVTQTLNAPGNTNVIYTINVPTGCCITGNAFLFVRFTGLAGCATGTGPGLTAAQGPCVPCEQYVTANNIFPTETEWCSIGATNPMWFSIGAECCSMTPVRDRSWGSLKTLYR